MTTAAVRARAYVYGGDWVADCPVPGCNNVEHLFGRERPRDPACPRTVRLPALACSAPGCHSVSLVEWPSDSFMEQVNAVLALRPDPATRNWYPKDHDVAVRFRVEHGQTVAQLREENEAHGVVAA